MDSEQSNLLNQANMAGVSLSVTTATLCSERHNPRPLLFKGEIMKGYCTQNAGDCSTCSLVNYGRDCMNNPVDDFEDDEIEKDETDESE